MMHNIFSTNSGICKIYKTMNALLYMFTGLQCTQEFIDSEFVLPRCFKNCSYVLASICRNVILFPPVAISVLLS